MVDILYMEDDAGIAHLIQDKLSHVGHDITICENGHDGLEVLKNTFFDIILLDFHMPDMNGVEVLKQIVYQNIETPVVMLTGAGNEMVAVEAMRNKAVDYIVKDTNLHFLELLPVIIEQVLQEQERKLAHQLAEMALSMERERSEIINTFISKAAHEFRTPLSIVTTSLYFLKRLSDDEKLLGHVQKIETQSERLTQLVDQLVTMTRLDTLKSITTTSVNLTNLLQQIIEPRQSIRDIDIILETDGSIFVDADAVQIKLAITHIIENAIHFNRSPGQVRVSAEYTDNNVQIMIEDDGIGVAGEHIPRLFERFYRVDSTHSTPGFGLGMSICQSIIDLHKGEIYFESEPGKGTSVTLVLSAPEE